MQPVKERNRSKRAVYKLDPSKLTLGERVPGALLTAEGRVLLRAGELLEPEFLHRLQCRLAQGLFGGDGWPEDFLVKHPSPRPRETPESTPDTGAPNEPIDSGTGSAKPGTNAASLIAIPVENLQPGTRLACNLYTRHGALLLSEGSQITYRLLCKLREYKIFDVHVEPNTALTQTAVDRTSPESRTSRRRKSCGRRRTTQRSQLRLSDLRAETERAKGVYQHSIECVGEMLKDALKGRRSSMVALRRLLSEFLDFAVLDASVLPGVMELGETPTEFLYKHGLNVALLSMTVASQLDLAEEEIADVGLGAVVQDLGMLCIPQELRLAPRSLTKAEQLEIKRHPIYSVDLLQHLDVTESSMMIAYQSHERPDRSGYPRGRHRMFIHPYARIVGAVDAYVALSSHRPHRDCRTPYQSMKILLKEAQQERQDREAVRSILDCMSLFPLGSHVQLSDGSKAKVLRASPGVHTRPVVVRLDDNGAETDDEVDLSQKVDLRVVKALSLDAVVQAQPDAVDARIISA